ncbi:MAG: N-acetylmuramoyl-L-alanine amidase [Paludibacter sp.]|nr:N-acetylmuramoyl-L-alanine amidase [Bacteroidales bacterium]MCM1069821.1 N-acetylmuramoyl-L-alanine amidase [Prevotella sp.]MCM1353985.1 N-acetylmuramoyl-L-alanine amidase [Bacteroides sp.]MCM1443373.1 N-acetylmuramoyl-L-alanine amidase [Muribaculum sp.]MCM1482076.1 N-acetylmuramoyl-L-alanine amidase [Paludibacter sp.]
MRTINEIIIHCTATPEGKAVDVQEIDRWHKECGWKGIGYHYVIYLDGTIHKGRPIEEVGAHCIGHNKHSIGICYVGGCDRLMHPKDTRTTAQRIALRTLVKQLQKQFPQATIHGHNEFANKACPSFDVQQFRKEERL